MIQIEQCDCGFYFDLAKHSICPKCGKKFRDNPVLDVEPVRPTMSSGVSEGYQHVVLVRERAAVRKVVLHRKKKDRSWSPVVGWLVCVKGRDKGRDYRLYYGFNRLGEDVRLRGLVKEKEQPGAIVYDNKSNQFYLVVQDGVIYRNEEAVTKTVLLENGDKLLFGEYEYQLIAFCEGDRKW